MTFSRDILEEAVEAHIAFARDRPWMQKPNPITIEVADVLALLAGIDAERDAACALLMRMHAEVQQSHFVHNYYHHAANRLRKNDHRS